jgi:hypothetical protein
MTPLLTVDGVFLTRYARGLRNPALIASVLPNGTDTSGIQSTIANAAVQLDVDGDGAFTVTDATILSRFLAGYEQSSWTTGLTIAGNAQRKNANEIAAYITAGCVTATEASLSLELRSATGGSQIPFTIGQVLRQGYVPSGSALVSDATGFQCVVKNRWPDGSAKFAILSGRVDLTANVAKSIGLSVVSAPAATAAISTAELKATGVTASVQFGSIGTVSWSAGDWDSPVQASVAGPEMSAFTYRKPIGSDAHLVAWLEVRVYKGGRVEVLPWIENGYLNVASPTAKIGIASFSLGGTQRFNQNLSLLNHQRAVLASGTTLTHWYGGADPQVTPRHNTAYLMSTKLVPNYRGTTAASSPLFAQLPTTYTPLGQASFADYMPATGYDPGIGLLPEWDVSYLTSGADPRSYRAVLINGYAAGRYGIHYRDETTNRALRFSSYPNLVMNTGSGVSSIGASSTNSYTPANLGAEPPIYDSPHHPSMGYMAYLLSGWNYYLEETQFLATANYLKQNNTTRQASKGIFESSSGTGITRGAAWSIRSLAQALTITPDADSLRSEFVGNVDENINYYFSRYVATANNPLGLVQPYDHYNGGTASDPWQAASWMDDFFTGTFGYMKDLRVNSAAAQTKLDQFLAWKYRSIVGRLGGSGTNAFSYRYAAQYTVNYAPSNSSDWDTGAGPWYSSWAAVARSMAIPTSGNLGEPLESGYPTEPTAYWGNLMPAISYAVDHAAPGASDAWTRITSAANFPTQADGYNDQPVWGVKPRGAALVPAPNPIPGGLGWYHVPNSNLQSVCPPDNYGGTTYPFHSACTGVTEAWSSAVMDTQRNRLIVWGGGHNDYYGNELYAVNMNSLSIERLNNPSIPTNLGNPPVGTLADGKPNARHTYDGLSYMDNTDRMFVFGGGWATDNGTFGDDTWTLNMATLAWQKMNPAGPIPKAVPGIVTAYDKNTGLVFLHDDFNLYSYNFSSNTYAQLASNNSIVYTMSAVIDPVRKKFLIIGGGEAWIYDITAGGAYTRTALNSTGGSAIIDSGYPGLAYDPVADRIVAWNGGNTVYSLNLDTNTWTPTTYSGGPGAAINTGTYKRFSYSPASGAFIVVNQMGNNAVTLKMR